MLAAKRVQSAGSTRGQIVVAHGPASDTEGSRSVRLRRNGPGGLRDGAPNRPEGGHESPAGTLVAWRTGVAARRLGERRGQDGRSWSRMVALRSRVALARAPTWDGSLTTRAGWIGT